ncbi:MAG: hypothetical protein OCD02_14140 [Spirochaetaceae bacterium]
MLSYQFDFDIEEGNINTFLIGSKKLFGQIQNIGTLLGNSIDIGIDMEYKLIELDNSIISYNLTFSIKYPVQKLLGANLGRWQIEAWINRGLDLILNRVEIEQCFSSIDMLATEIELDKNIVYVKIPENILEIALEDFEKLSILLFRKLTFKEK